MHWWVSCSDSSDELSTSKIKLSTNQVCVDAFSHTLQITFKVDHVVKFAWNERLHENLHVAIENKTHNETVKWQHDSTYCDYNHCQTLARPTHSSVHTYTLFCNILIDLMTCHIHNKAFIDISLRPSLVTPRGALYFVTLSPRMLIRPTTAKCDVIHKTWST